MPEKYLLVTSKFIKRVNIVNPKNKLRLLWERIYPLLQKPDFTA